MYVLDEEAQSEIRRNLGRYTGLSVCVMEDSIDS